MEAGRAPRCCSSLGTSGESEDLEKSYLAKGSTGQTKDMGPTCKQVVALIGNILKQVRSISFADWCTNMDWFALKPQGSKRRDTTMLRTCAHIHKKNLPWSKMLHHARLRCESKLIQSVEPIETANRGKRAPRHARRQKGEEAKRRPSHIGLVGLRENPLQHFTKNTRNTQVRCNKGKQLSISKRDKFEFWFSNSVSSIFNAEDM